MICSKIKISGTGISQVEDDQVLATIPKDQIRSVALGHDSRSKHPFLRFLSGFVLLVTGLILVIAAFIMAEGGVYVVKIRSLSLGIPLAPLVIWLMVGVGLWLLIGVFRGRYNLLVSTEQGGRKMFFEESADVKEIVQFIRRANQELDYRIDLSLTESMYIPEDRCESRSDA